MCNAVLFVRTVVECDDRHHAVVQSKDRHEEEALQLEIHAEYRGCGGREHEQDLIHSKCHDGSDRHHQDGRDTDRVDRLYGLSFEPHACRMNVDLVVARHIEENAEQHRDDLAEYSRECGTGHAHLRKAEVAEDQDRVKDDIQDRAEALRQHRIERHTGRLQEPLHRDLQENADRQSADDGHVLHAIFDDLCVVGLHREKDAGAEQPEQAEDREADQGEQNAVVRRFIRLLKIFLAKASGEQGVDADTGTGSDRDHQVLDRECERDRSQCVLIDL